CQETSNLKLTF
nr:immunoglobulin light chain junction region [Macaca mulatta]MOV74423.1 immunoglobulin light chain junction region [Macaca mulatta]MOV74428.1 immunoglobulin light chain junction region [Macaca mulatta]MOV74772.1 immunoglobulin light chain junction region [Macaca mulatta]MOV74825.1 immunoglobulin light chain junction region [Macaca mulatta]